MIPILYQTVTEGTVPTNYGIGALTDCISCKVTEKRNGAYELTLTYAAEGIHASEIQPNRFIKVKPNYTDNPQLFRIYKVGKTMNGKFEVKAQHISYDLSGKIISSGTASSCAAACTLLEAQAGNFTISTDKNVSGSFSVSEPSSVRSWFGGKQGSLLDIYGGEWYYDNYSVSLKNARGLDRGVTIRYGKNLTQLSQILDMSNLVTGIVPYYKDANGNKTVGTKVSTGLVLDVTRDVAIDFSQDVDPESSTAIATQLANLATRYIANNQLTTLSNSITLDFVQLQGLTERVDLCDTVHIYFEALGITATAKCVAVEWDVLQERYTKCTFGDARTDITDKIAANTKQLENTASRAYVNESSQLITGNLGGYVILHDSDGDGKPDEILIMNTDDPSTATQVWRFNKGGLGYGTSYSGPFDDIALTSDGKINASRITTGTLSANRIKAGVLSDTQGNSSINMTTGAATLNEFKAKTSLTLVNSSNQTRGLFYIDGSGNTRLYLSSANYNDLVKIWAQDSNGSGVIQLCRSNGNSIVEIGETGDNSGGGMGIRNSSNYVVGELKTGSAGDGMLYLKSSVGSDTIWALGQSGGIYCTSVTQYSSRDIKENIKPIEDAEKILELEAVSFDYKNKDFGTDKRGFIAEDVEKVLPNLVSKAEGLPTTLDYLEMIPYLQAVIKEQEKRIKALEDKLNGNSKS
jgi:phage minor structural protein